jgi:ribonucleoside-diphosphate reductase alpha chain
MQIAACPRAPFAWMNDVSRQFLGKDYLLNGQSGEQRVGFVADAFGKRLGRPDLADKFYDYVGRGWYSLSSPVWSNYGLTRGLPISCFGSYIEDDMRSILKTHAEIGMMSKYGGGTSAYLNQLRGRGSVITDNGHSAGGVNFALLFDTEIRVVSQGSSRRGECAVYWDIDHPDVPEALTIRHPESEIQKLSYGLCISDAWMRSLIAGDAQKRELWAKVIKARMKTGYPYLVFIDNANKAAPEEYRHHRLRINHSNLCCVAGSERVVSDRGLKTARELYEEGGELTLFDGNMPVKASPMRLVSEDQPLLRIRLKNGAAHTVTPCHRVQTARGMVAASDIVLGDKIVLQTASGLFGQVDMEDEAFLLGLYQGDGTQAGKNIMIDLWENDFDLVDEVEERFERVHNKYGCDTYTVRVSPSGDTITRGRKATKFFDCVVRQSKVKKKRLATRTLKKALDFKKGIVPQWIWEGTEATQWQYVRGLFFTDGTASQQTGRPGTPLHLSLASVSREFLLDLQILLLNLGVKFAINTMREAGETLLPDGRGGERLYPTRALYRLVCGSRRAARLFDEKTGFLSRKGVIITSDGYKPRDYSEVIEIEDAGRGPVYCPEVYTDEHKWTCNGVVTHNSEIFLSNGPHESFVCCLSSMNMLRYDEWKDTDAVETMIYFLDTVMSEFIDKAKGEYGFERAVLFAERQRALGLGQIGWHSYLMSKMVPYDSMEANSLAAQTSKRIKEQAFAASAKMAAEYGEPHYLKGSGRRHMTLTAIAPTQSSSAILEQVSEGIECVIANFAIKDKQKVKYTYRNPFLLEILEARGKNTPDVIDSIFSSKGSVQHLDFLDAKEKAVFKTLREISPMAVVQQAAARQPYVCQGQSLNLLVDPEADLRQVNKVYIAAWELGLKSLYYQKNVSAAQEFVQNLTSCSSCEG